MIDEFDEIGDKKQDEVANKDDGVNGDLDTDDESNGVADGLNVEEDDASVDDDDDDGDDDDDDEREDTARIVREEVEANRLLKTRSQAKTSRLYFTRSNPYPRRNYATSTPPHGGDQEGLSAGTGLFLGAVGAATPTPKVKSTPAAPSAPAVAPVAPAAPATTPKPAPAVPDAPAPPTPTPFEAEPAQVPMRVKMENFVHELQSNIVAGMESLEAQASPEDTTTFLRDHWQRAEGGFGTSCVLQNGKVFEKAGVLVSVVHGPANPRLIAEMRARAKPGIDVEKKYNMFAAGMSLVIHPHNPNAPTSHANYRYFELTEDGQDKPAAWWFGGGSDLTPSYLFEEDAIHFHKTIKDACDAHDPAYYPKFKSWCDDYFRITHRNESRGVGGIFFDDLEDRDPEEIFAFVQSCGNAFVEQYKPIVAKRMDMPFTEEMKRWQQLRRGRYVEFNLVYDRGTKFGLATPGARIESIMCSLPLTARWEYMHTPPEGSEEAKLIEVLKNPKDWASLAA
ncbi:Coproporphyrinogen-III oxidase [Chytridiales sp. JEL 0842]|nr:Coproporphyrinogen-III oxidase [Chytridiales sp. JEL 0842]